MTIIGFVGFIGSGKGTAGDILTEFGFQKESFSGPVKEIASTMFNWSRELLEGDTEESRKFRETPDEYWSKKFDRNFTPREALQTIGTEIGRDMFEKDFWIHLLEKRINSKNNYIITDVRFPNEIDWIHENGGHVIEIIRGEHPYWYNTLTRLTLPIVRNQHMEHFNVHESEWSWVGYNIDYRIENNNTIASLKSDIVEILTNLDGCDNILIQ